MLVLTRKANESIVIDDNVIVTVLEIRGRSVRLGIQAPNEVPIRRFEVTVEVPAQSGETGEPDVPSR